MLIQIIGCPSTISKMLQEVLNAMMPWADAMLRLKDTSYEVVPDELAEYSPLFDRCIGAIDGTHIEVCVDEACHDDFTNRHGWTSQNVIAACNFNMMFTYIGVGTEGSAHDMRVLKKKALEDSKFPRPPEGTFATIFPACRIYGMLVLSSSGRDYEHVYLATGHYYLVDSGYAFREGYMAPYPSMRYHVKEFKNRPPWSAEELFNRHHSRLRNVIERTFGAAKSKWQLLKGVPHYPHIKQSQLIMAGCALWNLESSFSNGIKP